jgi:electron-transferring-flavoprotein dehydrogenase
MLSGAVLDLSALRDLIPDYKDKGAPLLAEVGDEDVLVLTESSKISLPIIPPPLKNHGNYIISLNQFVRWLTSQVEAAGVDFFSGFAGEDVLMDGERVVGVRTPDRGIDKHGNPKATFEPGVDIHAKVTIFCDGVRGNLTKELMRRLPLGDSKHPQQFAIGLKELWEIPPDRLKAGSVVHTLGYPLKHEEFGGGFIYAMPHGQLSIGFVAGLDYKDPLFDPHMAFNRFKQHPFVSALLAGGQMIRYGAKALPEGGWNTIPRVYMDGALIAGDAGAFLNSMRLKGIHLAMRTGMLAAETAFDAVRAGDTSASALKAYRERIDRSAVRDELYPVRNAHQAFEYGLVPGLAFAGVAVVTHGWSPVDLQGHPGHQRMKQLAWYYGSRQVNVDRPSNATTIDRRLTFDKLTNVHFSGTSHDEDQPSHLLVHTEVCSSICGPEYGHPCTRFCPANVYEIAHEADGTPRLQINAANCVHCKTCDIMDPYQVITWVPPEDGGGPQYNGM